MIISMSEEGIKNEAYIVMEGFLPIIYYRQDAGVLSTMSNS
ncbi:hypothetical protein [Halobacillus seohaensis]